MALYIPHNIFHLARLSYVRLEAFGPYYVRVKKPLSLHLKMLCFLKCSQVLHLSTSLYYGFEALRRLALHVLQKGFSAVDLHYCFRTPSLKALAAANSFINKNAFQ